MRDSILTRIRATTKGDSMARMNEYSAIPRLYRQRGELDSTQRVALFMERLIDYDAAVYRCSEKEISETVAQALRARAKTGLVIPSALPKAWLPTAFEFIHDENFTYEQLDQSEGVMTACAGAIALTGTLILEHTPASGRRALTLIPDYHLCVCFEHQVVETVAEAMALLSTSKGRPITTISGPSATADIEMTRVKGVHGPRFLDVILVAAAEA